MAGKKRTYKAKGYQAHGHSVLKGGKLIKTTDQLEAVVGTKRRGRKPLPKITVTEHNKLVQQAVIETVERVHQSIKDELHVVANALNEHQGSASVAQLAEAYLKARWA